MFLLASCSSILKIDQDKEKELKLKSDIDQKLIIEETPTVADVPIKKEDTKVKVQTKKSTPPPLLIKPVVSAKKTSDAKIAREPSIEDAEGFEGRRPVQDPFVVGERIKHEVFYNFFKITAGEMTYATLPFKTVNGRKAYQFEIELKTTSLFSSFYAVDDRVNILVDYDLWVPRLFTLHVKESSQLREGRQYFDFENNKARYEEKKITSKKGVEEKKQEWELAPYSQNVFSLIYYMRLFAWKDGRDYSFRVADDGENLVFKGRVVEREILKTPIGELKAIKIKPEITVKGAFKPVGDIFIWLSDDARKIPLRIESKIKIGTLVSEILDYQPGTSQQ